MTYQQLISTAMVKLGEGDLAGAEAGFKAAVAEAARVDPGGPREGEALSYLARHYEMAGQADEAAATQAKVAFIYGRFQGLADADT